MFFYSINQKMYNNKRYKIMISKFIKPMHKVLVKQKSKLSAMMDDFASNQLFFYLSTIDVVMKELTEGNSEVFAMAETIINSKGKKTLKLFSFTDDCDEDIEILAIFSSKQRLFEFFDNDQSTPFTVIPKNKLFSFMEENGFEEAILDRVIDLCKKSNLAILISDCIKSNMIKERQNEILQELQSGNSRVYLLTNGYLNIKENNMLMYDKAIYNLSTIWIFSTEQELFKACGDDDNLSFEKMPSKELMDMSQDKRFTKLIVDRQINFDI